jgi:colanic acid biosynthesis glycosyl transferase WcaI
MTRTLAKVLIVGMHYRPESTGNAPYTTEMAEYLAERGHQTTVISGFPHYPAWRHEYGEHRWRATEVRNHVRVLRRRHYVPHSQSAIQRAAYEGTFLVHGALSRPERPDVVFGVIPSLSDGLLARHFAFRARSPYGLIFQDLVALAASQSGIAGGTRMVSTVAALERWATERASAVAIVSEGFRAHLRSIGVHERRIFHLPNWARLGEPTASRRMTRDRLGWPPDWTVALHAGNLGLKQGLEQVVEAARRADATAAPVRYILMGDGSQRSVLEALGRGVDRISFQPFQPEDEVINVLNAADVLLVSERATVLDMSLPSKLTSYFTAGRPIVAAVAPDGSTAREVLRSGAGVLAPIGDPDELNRVVTQLRDEPERAARMGQAGRAYAKSALDAATARRRIDEFLERTIREPRPR